MWDGSACQPYATECTSCSAKPECWAEATCFDCPVGEFFNIDTMSCVASCTATQLSLEGAQFHGKKLCRTPTYFVDSSSGSLLELGTETYPYKSIGLVYLEITNYGVSADLNWIINIRSGTINEFLSGDLIAYEAGLITV